jgi:hypothetical protein
MDGKSNVRCLPMLHCLPATLLCSRRVQGAQGGALHERGETHHANCEHPLTSLSDILPHSSSTSEAEQLVLRSTILLTEIRLYLDPEFE